MQAYSGLEARDVSQSPNGEFTLMKRLKVVLAAQNIVRWLNLFHGWLEFVIFFGWLGDLWLQLQGLALPMFALLEAHTLSLVIQIISTL